MMNNKQISLELRKLRGKNKSQGSIWRSTFKIIALDIYM
jgi:hypothetical protein